VARPGRAFRGGILITFALRTVRTILGRRSRSGVAQAGLDGTSEEGTTTSGAHGHAAIATQPPSPGEQPPAPVRRPSAACCAAPAVDLWDVHDPVQLDEPGAASRPADRDATLGRRARAARRRRRAQVEALLVIVLAGIAVAVRAPMGALVAPLWADNAWLLVGQASPSAWLGIAGSRVPIGWALLLELASSTGVPELLRLIPLALGALTTIPAYLLGRRVVASAPVTGGLACGLAAALGPVLLATGDARQAAIEVFAACALLATVPWVEVRLTWRRVAALAVAGVAAMLVASSAVPILAVAAAALATKAAHRRAWGLPGSVAVATGSSAAAVGGVTAWAATIGDGPARRLASAVMAASPETAELAGRAGMALAGTASRTAGELELTGIRSWQLALVLAGAGVVGLWRARWVATAIAAAATWIGFAVLGAAGGHPFAAGPGGSHWAARTGGLLTTLLTILSSAGFAWLATLALRHGRTLTHRRAHEPQPAPSETAPSPEDRAPAPQLPAPPAPMVHAAAAAHVLKAPAREAAPRASASMARPAAARRPAPPPHPGAATPGVAAPVARPAAARTPRPPAPGVAATGAAANGTRPIPGPRPTPGTRTAPAPASAPREGTNLRGAPLRGAASPEAAAQESAPRSAPHGRVPAGPTASEAPPRARSATPVPPASEHPAREAP
jgi:hypothetical protein